MGSVGLEWDASDGPSIVRLNQKTTFVGTGAQISGITTYPGQHAFCTVTGSGFTADTLYVRNAANDAWIAVLFTESAEQETTPVTDGADFSVTAGHRYYAFFTLPTTEKLYTITEIEWKNGAGIAGNIICGIDVIDADPPTLDHTVLGAWTTAIAQSGASSLQSNTQLSSNMFRAGTILGVWISCSSSSADLREETGLSSQNQQKATSYDASPDTGDATAWVAATARKYLKVKYRGYS